LIGPVLLVGLRAMSDAMGRFSLLSQILPAIAPERFALAGNAELI